MRPAANGRVPNSETNGTNHSLQQLRVELPSGTATEPGGTDLEADRVRVPLRSTVVPLWVPMQVIDIGEQFREFRAYGSA